VVFRLIELPGVSKSRKHHSGPGPTWFRQAQSEGFDMLTNGLLNQRWADHLNRYSALPPFFPSLRSSASFCVRLRSPGGPFPKLIGGRITKRNGLVPLQEEIHDRREFLRAWVAGAAGAGFYSQATELGPTATGKRETTMPSEETKPSAGSRRPAGD